MKPAMGSGEGTLTPFRNADRAIERTVTSTALAIRAVHVAQGVTCLATARSSYRRPKLAAGAAALSVLEFAWLSHRALTRRSADPLAARIDAAFSLGGLLAFGYATEPQDRTSSLNWMMPLAVGSCMNALRGVTMTEAFGIASGLAGAYAFTTRDALRSHSGRTATAIANTMSFPAFSLVAGLNVRLARRLASELDAARLEAVTQSARAAGEAARNQEHRLLHDSALQTLEAIAVRGEGIPDEIRDLARREASMLRQAISDQPGVRSDLTSGLQDLVTEFAGRGLQIDLLTAEVMTEPSTAHTQALTHATRECLTNALKHADASRAVVRVVSDDTTTRITIRDHGRGFDPSSVAQGFGIANSVKGRLADIGGTVSITTGVGKGTRVELLVRR
jgi:signal transduction histidine kinase